MVSISQPSRGVNFGPVAFNAERMAKTLELKNEGEFEFVFILQVETGGSRARQSNEDSRHTSFRIDPCWHSLMFGQR